MFDWNCKGELPANGNDLPPKMWTICKSRSPPWVALKGLLRRCAHSPNCAFSARSLLACLGPDWNVGRIFYGSLSVLGPDLAALWAMPARAVLPTLGKRLGWSWVLGISCCDGYVLRYVASSNYRPNASLLCKQS